MTNQKIKSPQFHSGLLAFFLSFSVLILALTAQFINKYKEDLFEKNLDSVLLFKMIFFTIVTLTSLVLPISILVMAFVFYRSKSGSEDFDLKSAIHKSKWINISVCILSFLWISFVVPKATLHQYGLLYDIQSKSPEEPLSRTDLKVFSQFHSTCNLFQLGSVTDENDRIKYQLNAVKMVGFPFLIFLSFYIGMFLGILNRNHQYFAIQVIFIYFTVFPGIYFLMTWFEKLTQERALMPMEGQFYFLGILSVITLILFLFTKRQLRPEETH